MSTSRADDTSLDLVWAARSPSSIERGEDEALLEKHQNRKTVRTLVIGLVAIMIIGAVSWNLKHTKSNQKVKVSERLATRNDRNPNGEYGNAFEGDILATPGQIAGAYGKEVAAAHFGVAADNIEADPVKLWPRGVVYYEYLARVTHPDVKVMVDEAIAHLQSNVPGIKIKLRTNEEHYVQINQTTDGCYSNQGAQGGPQTLSVDPKNCANYTVVHEFMHTLGFWHEQSRPDRDNYVTIHPENMKTDTLRWFQKRSTDVVELRASPYDYSSLMHYNKLAFTKNDKPTILPVANPPSDKGGNPKRMGMEKVLSVEDIRQLKDAYPETVTCRQPVNCKFPFVYKDYVFTSCTSFDHDQPWCSKDATFNNKWLNCKTETGDKCGDCPCVFPFQYSGNTYHKCTKNGTTNGRLWCSLNATYSSHYHWCRGYCPQ